MRAVVIPEYGGTEVLTLREVPDPQPGPEEVLVQVRASAMNRADLLQRAGGYPAPGPTPEFEVPGLEFAGTIVATGSQVTSWSDGDQVMGIVGGGAQNELLSQMTADACNCRVDTGPIEATAIGNVMMQAVAAGAVSSISEARAVIRNSFPVKEYTPVETGMWDDAFNRFRDLIT